MADLRKLMESTGIVITDEEQESSKNHPQKCPVVKIKLNHHGGGATWIGDFLVPYVTRVSFDAGVSGPPKVHIELLASAVHVEAEADVDLTVTSLEDLMKATK